jgi:RsiW-degrading membrane proteinase PrsW (M82 family)
MSGSGILLILIFISSVPLIMVFIWYRLAKYPITHIQFLFALLVGAAAFIPALILQYVLDFPLQASARLTIFYQFFVRIAFTEELSRFALLFIFFLIINRRQTDPEISYNTVKAGAAIGLAAGLGFALLESAVYGASNSNVMILRTVTAAPLHGACGSRIGTSVVMVRSNPVQAIFHIFAATAIHGTYNFMASMRGFPSIAAIIIAISALLSSIITIRGWTVTQSLEDSL